MESLKHIVLGFLILQIYVHAAPSDVSKLEEIAKVEQADLKVEQTILKAEQADLKEEQTALKVEQGGPIEDQTEHKLDSEPQEVESDNNSTETQRHKRWYNPYGYGVPPFNPFINQGYNKRDDSLNTGYYGEDPLTQIHRRIQEIAHYVRNPQQQPTPPSHIPIYYPVLFIPPGDCNCNSYNENQNPTTPEPYNPVTPNNNGGNNNVGNDNGGNNNGDNNDGDNTGTTPVVVNRWSVMEDERQNWGFLINETDSEEGVEFNRPISFDPIRLNRPKRPPPPVEHGTIQSDSNNQDQPQSEAPSSQTPPLRPQPQTTRRPFQNSPQNTPPPRRPLNTEPPQRPPTGLAPPSRCDGAILTCCHQPQVVYDCFAIQGCPELTVYGNPCQPNEILRVVEWFRTYYKQRYNK